METIYARHPAMNIDPEWLGIPAALLTTAAYIPQAVKVLREKHTQSISLAMYSIMTCGGLMWLAYGLMLGSYPLILANGFTSILTCIILVMKLKHG
jgi:MtN3 and saliva related transmembrane protein